MMKTMNTNPHQLAYDNRKIIDKVLQRSLFTFLPQLREQDLQDLFSEGYLALYKAAISFSMEKGTHFTTFAYTCVKNHLLDYINRIILHSYTYLPLNEEWAAEDEQQTYGNETMLYNLDVQLAMDTLDMRERDIFSNKTGIGIDHKALDSQELATRYHLTPQHVNRLYNKALEKVQHFMTA